MCVLCLGDPTVDKFKGDHLVFMAAGSDPFDVITKAVKSVTLSLPQILCIENFSVEKNFSVFQ